MLAADLAIYRAHPAQSTLLYPSLEAIALPRLSDRDGPDHPRAEETHSVPWACRDEPLRAVGRVVGRAVETRLFALPGHGNCEGTANFGTVRWAVVTPSVPWTVP